MPKIAKIPPRGSRYGPFLSVGRLIGLSSEGTRDAFKAQFLPQWEDNEAYVEAVLSKRFLMIDLGMAELAYADFEGAARIADGLAEASRNDPERLRMIANAFGPSGSREDREMALSTAAQLRLTGDDDDDPVAFWGAVLLVGAALLVAACCNKTDSDCGSNGTDTDDDKGAGGSTDGDTD